MISSRLLSSDTSIPSDVSLSVPSNSSSGEEKNQSTKAEAGREKPRRPDGCRYSCSRSLVILDISVGRAVRLKLQRRRLPRFDFLSQHTFGRLDL